MVRVRLTRADSPEAAALIDEYLAELAQLLGGFDPRRSVSAEPDEMTLPSGAFLVLETDDGPVACGGLKAHAPGVGEIKRMYVRPSARGQGHGRRVLTELEAVARSAGMRRIVLDTAAPLEPASRLYRAAGYREVTPFNDNPYARYWFAKELAP